MCLTNGFQYVAIVLACMTQLMVLVGRLCTIEVVLALTILLRYAQCQCIPIRWRCAHHARDDTVHAGQWVSSDRYSLICVAAVIILVAAALCCLQLSL